MIRQLERGGSTGGQKSVREFGIALASTHILLNEIDLIGGDIEPGARTELKQHVLAELALGIEDLQPLVPGDAMIDMDDEIAFSEIEKTLDGPCLVLADGNATRSRRRFPSEK